MWFRSCTNVNDLLTFHYFNPVLPVIVRRIYLYRFPYLPDNKLSCILHACSIIPVVFCFFTILKECNKNILSPVLVPLFGDFLS